MTFACGHKARTIFWKDDTVSLLRLARYQKHQEEQKDKALCLTCFEKSKG